MKTNHTIKIYIGNIFNFDYRIMILYIKFCNILRNVKKKLKLKLKIELTKQEVGVKPNPPKNPKRSPKNGNVTPRKRVNAATYISKKFNIRSVIQYMKILLQVHKKYNKSDIYCFLPT